MSSKTRKPVAGPSGSPVGSAARLCKKLRNGRGAASAPRH
jgi:hypothetical protein